ncbi:MAG: lasso peptide biosynthesis B2 protein [Pyrinomonadaceae bacterium]
MKFLPFLFSAGKTIVRHPSAAMLRVRMAGWVCVLSLAVKLQPLPRALALLSVKTKQSSGQSFPAVAEKLAGAIDPLLATGLLCFRPVCWKRAAVLHRYLALNGITTQIMFGIRKETDGTLGGHAWLEAEGTPILERVAPDYIVTYTFPSSERFEIDLASLARTSG